MGEARIAGATLWNLKEWVEKGVLMKIVDEAETDDHEGAVKNETSNPELKANLRITPRL